MSNFPRLDETGLTYLVNKLAEKIRPNKNVQSDWNESDSTSDAYIKNKPSSMTNVYSPDDSASTTINDTDYIPISESDGTTKKKALWTTIVGKVKSALGISSGDTYLKKDGTWGTPTDSTKVAKIGDTMSGVLNITRSDGVSTGLNINNKNGTTSTVGVSQIVLGNSIASGTAQNSRGLISMFSDGTSYTSLWAHKNADGTNQALYFPGDKNGATIFTNQGGTINGLVILDRRNGTTSEIGYSGLILGNNIKSGTDKNSKGYIRLYSEGSGYMDFKSVGTHDGNYELLYQTKSGTIALTSDLPTNQAAASGGTANSLVTTGDKYTWNNQRAVNLLLTNENLNNVTTPGFYNAGGSNTCTNTGLDSGTAFGLEVVHTAAGNYYWQIINPCGSTNFYRRVCNNGTWGAWTLDRYNWRGIQNNLTSDSTTDSLSAAQGKALANGSARDSTKVAKSGDTMTGNLTINSGGTATSQQYNYLTIGNATAVNTAGNRAGVIRLYSTGTAYAEIYCNQNLSSTASVIFKRGGTVAMCTSDITSGQVMISDGTLGGIKSSGYTIAKSVPSDAKFSDTTYSSQAAASGGTAVSLCTTGEKYTWNNKVNKAGDTMTGNLVSTAKIIVNRADGNSDCIEANTKNGTTSKTGISQIVIGNNLATGTDQNSIGSLVIFSANTNYVGLRANSGTSGNLYLPAGRDGQTVATTAQLTDGSVTKVGTAIKGGSDTPIYLNAGTPTVCSSFVPVTGGSFRRTGGDNTIVYIGSNTSGYKGAGRLRIYVTPSPASTTGDFYYINLLGTTDGYTGDRNFYFPNNSGTIQTSGSSSRRVKENIHDMTEERAKKLLDLNIVNFDYIGTFGGGKKDQSGVIAEDAVKVIPEAVEIPKNYDESKPVDENTNPAPSVDYRQYIPYLIKMVQMQQSEIEELKETIKSLKEGQNV